MSRPDRDSRVSAKRGRAFRQAGVDWWGRASAGSLTAGQTSGKHRSASGLAQILLEMCERALPGELGRVGVEARRGVVVESVLRARILEPLVPDVGCLQRRLVGRPGRVDALVDFR